MKPPSKALEWLKTIFKRYFLLGLIVLLPFYVTVRFLIFAVGYVDGILSIQNGRFLYVIPERFHPDALLGIHLPGLGLIVAVVFIVMVGISSRNYFGNQLIRLGDKLIDAIPFARTIYRVVKEVLRNFTQYSGFEQFERVVLIEYPRKDLFTMAFVTGRNQTYLEKKAGTKLVNVFVPTTPNPTSGYLLFVPETDIRPLNMSIENAFRLIVSGGMVNSQPPDAQNVQ